MNSAYPGVLGRDSARLNLLFLGLTAMFVGYFMVWLPGPSAGLQLIGVEIGEWIKFLGMGAGRDLFYLPPIALGLALALLAATWPNNRPRTWLARGLAVAVSLLAFPAIAAIQSEPASQWLARLLAIALVALVAVVGAIIAGRSPASAWPWLLMAVVILVGVILPTWQYFSVQSIVEAIMRRPIGIGAGVWMNAAGGGLAAAAAFSIFLATRRIIKQPSDGRLSGDKLDW
jgi:hypothetical protein